MAGASSYAKVIAEGWMTGPEGKAGGEVTDADASATRSGPIVSFQNVEFRHAGGAAVVRDLSLDCAPGEVIAIVGRSGAGKSTLLKLVNRLFLPSAGQVVVQGKDTAAWDPVRLRRSIGYVLQDAALFPHLTVEENVGVVPQLEGWTPERIAARVRELLDLVGLPAPTYGGRRPAELSGGQRQRVGLARALAVNPPMLLMDEPFGALDAITRSEVRSEFSSLQKRLGTAALIVTHDINEAAVLAHRIGVMDGGVLVAVDTPAALMRNDDARVASLIASAQTTFGVAR